MDRGVVSFGGTVGRVGRSISSRTSALRGSFALRRVGATLGRRVRCAGVPIVSRRGNSTIEIGDRVSLISSARRTALGVGHPVILRTVCEGAVLRIGSDTGISGGSICAAISVTIGERCLLGADVVVCDTDFHPVSPLGRRSAPIPNPQVEDSVWIGDDVFIGARTVVLKGVRVGNGSVIGAGSVVTSDIPPFVIAAGNPARVIGDLREGETRT